MHAQRFVGDLRGAAPGIRGRGIKTPSGMTEPSGPMAARRVRSPAIVVSDIAGLVGSVLICFVAAAVGGKATIASVRTWYPTLRKPSWNPPARLFGPVWSTLYLMMAIAAWLVWRTRDTSDVGSELGLFSVQLVLNVLWSIIFFGLRRPGLALVDIGLLWIAIAATAIAFWSHDPIGALLLVPYFAWVSFAAALNLSIYRLNAAR
jgi:translocator protein